MVALATPLSVQEVRGRGSRHLYPTEMLDGCKTALVLFAAAFHGRQDACWVEEAGIRATCVDHDADRMNEMAAIYPESWEWVVDDVYAFAMESQILGCRWDLVSIDSPSGDSFRRCEHLRHLWSDLARRVIVLGTDPARRVSAPGGWKVAQRIHRSSIADWTVFSA